MKKLFYSTIFCLVLLWGLIDSAVAQIACPIKCKKILNITEPLIQMKKSDNIPGETRILTANVVLANLPPTVPKITIQSTRQFSKEKRNQYKHLR